MSADLSSQGIGLVTVAGNWLGANGRLSVCIAKSPKRVDQIATDTESPGSLAFAQAILSRNANSISPLQTWFANNPGLLIFPEYAFSSRDYAAIDACVKDYQGSVIILAGFGAVQGAELAALIAAGCQPTWQGGADTLVEHGRYNAGWCWIRDAPGSTRCFIFVKNYIDQAVEIAEIPNLQTLDWILKIETDDLVIYPLICSDLICAQQRSPRTRIEQSLPTTAKRVAVCTISCNAAPHSGWWRTAIDHVVQMQQQQAVLLFVNQPVTAEQITEDADRWRCMSGAFISRSRMPKAPRSLLPHERNISTEVAARGLILRHPSEGVDVGLVGWDLSSPAVGLYVWEPRMRLTWNNDQFVPITGTVDFYETCRFVSRRRQSIVSCFPQASQTAIMHSLSAIIAETDERMVTPRLWPDLLDGLKRQEPPRSADSQAQDQDDLDMALGIFGAVVFATAGQPVLEGRERGQVLWHDKEVRVWRSPLLLEDDMLRSLQKVALDGGSAPPLIVVGRGRQIGIGAPAQQVEAPAQQALPEKQTDITHAISCTGIESDIESARSRLVYWQNMSKLEQVLLHPPAQLADAICGAIIDELTLA